MVSGVKKVIQAIARVSEESAVRRKMKTDSRTREAVDVGAHTRMWAHGSQRSGRHAG
jgi:hypothetical protein